MRVLVEVSSGLAGLQSVQVAQVEVPGEVVVEGPGAVGAEGSGEVGAEIEMGDGVDVAARVGASGEVGEVVEGFRGSSPLALRVTELLSRLQKLMAGKGGLPGMGMASGSREEPEGRTQQAGVPGQSWGPPMADAQTYTITVDWGDRQERFVVDEATASPEALRLFDELIELAEQANG